MNSEFLECRPIAQANARVNQWHFHEIVKRLLLFFGQVWAQVRNCHIPTRENAALCPRGINLSVRSVSNSNFLFGFSAAHILRANDSAIQPNTNGIRGVVQAIVRNLCGYDILCEMAWHGVRYQFADKQSGDGGVTIGKMK